jgi:hypothetical protein
LILERLSLIEPAVLSVDEVTRFMQRFAQDGVEAIGLEAHDEAGHDEGADEGVVEGKGVGFEMRLQLRTNEARKQWRIGMKVSKEAIVDSDVGLKEREARTYVHAEESSDEGGSSDRKSSH